MSDDFLRNMANNPAMQSIQRIAQQQRQQEKDNERMIAAVGQAGRQKAERERTTADSTKALADYAAEQHEENRRLRYLTNVLAFAVIYDVVNGSFDDHTWWTTAISLAAGVAVLAGALLLGKWRARRAASISSS